MKRYALAAVIALVLLAGLPALVVNLPAARVLAWVDPAGISVHGASGPLRAGRAERVELPDVPVLTAVTWDMTLWRLATGLLHADVHAQLADVEADGQVSVTPARTLRIDDLELHGPVAGLARAAGWPVALGGNLRAHIGHARLERGQPPRDVRGRATWSNARLYAPLPLSLGEVTIDIEPAGNGHRATVNAEGGELDVDGEWELDADGRYRVDFLFTPSERAPKQVHDLLALLGAREEGGRYRIRMDGRAS